MLAIFSATVAAVVCLSRFSFAARSLIWLCRFLMSQFVLLSPACANCSANLALTAATSASLAALPILVPSVACATRAFAAASSALACSSSACAFALAMSSSAVRTAFVASCTAFCALACASINFGTDSASVLRSARTDVIPLYQSSPNVPAPSDSTSLAACAGL